MAFFIKEFMLFLLAKTAKATKHVKNATNPPQLYSGVAIIAFTVKAVVYSSGRLGLKWPFLFSSSTM
jgi:hypothetical protein